MEKTYKIALGEKTFEIDAPLTFKQLRIVEPTISRMIPLMKDGATEDGYDRMADVILTCVMRKNPEFTRAELDNTPVTREQVLEAFHVIGVASGLLKEVAVGQQQGEATAETTNPSTGA